MKTRNVMLAVLAAFLAMACGGGKGSIIGVGNSGNDQGAISEVAEDLGEGLAATNAIEPISDETLNEIYQALLAKARQGDIEAALTIVELAAAQREE